MRRSAAAGALQLGLLLCWRLPPDAAAKCSDHDGSSCGACAGTGSGLLGKCGWCGIDQKCVACKGIECKLATKCAAHQMVTSAQQCPAPRAHSPCVGNSSSLAPLECAAWQDLFDGIGLSKNKGGMAGTRREPCGSKQGGGGGVICKDGHIIHIEVFPDQYPNHPHGGHLPDTLVHLTHLEHLVLFCHGLVGRVPPLNFSAISNGCAIHDPMGSRDCYTENGKIFADHPNNFSCPLPPGAAEHCHAKCHLPPLPGPPPPIHRP